MKKFSVREIQPNGESRKRALYIIIQLHVGKMSLHEKKEEEIWKKLLTCVPWCGIIIKLSRETASRWKANKNISKKYLTTRTLRDIINKLSREGERHRTLKIEQYRSLNGTLIVMENHVKQFQYTSNSWMQALLYLRNYSDLIQSNLV